MLKSTYIININNIKWKGLHITSVNMDVEQAEKGIANDATNHLEYYTSVYCMLVIA